MPSRVVDSSDAYQRRHRRLGFPLAVAYKFGDDHGPYLTALITYYGFLSLFPLLLLLTTILGFVLEGDPDLQEKLVDSTLAELPIIGSQLRENVHSLKGSGVGLAVGILGTLYGCMGAAGATQNAFNRVWAVPGAITSIGVCVGAVVAVVGDTQRVTTGGAIAAISAGALAATVVAAFVVRFYRKRICRFRMRRPRRRMARGRSPRGIEALAVQGRGLQVVEQKTGPRRGPRGPIGQASV